MSRPKPRNTGDSSPNDPGRSSVMLEALTETRAWLTESIEHLESWAACAVDRSRVDLALRSVGVRRVLSMLDRWISASSIEPAHADSALASDGGLTPAMKGQRPHDGNTSGENHAAHV